VSSYGVNINFKVVGQNKIDRATSSAQKLEASISRIRSIDLSKAVGGPSGDRIAVALTQLRRYAQQVNKLGKTIGDTPVQQRAAASAFREVAENAKVGSFTFEQFTKAAFKQNESLKGTERATENVIRSMKGMQTVEQREHQLLLRGNKLRDLRLQKEKALDLKAKTSARIRTSVSSAIIGGGFPLLFGQGPTAAIGGALGGAVGGALGGQFGFALSIAGTTIGSALDSLANALAKPTENIQLLVDKVGLANTPTGDLALRLEKVGLSASAADLLLDEFNKKFGKTPEDIKKNTQQMNKFKNQINELGTAITLLLSKVLSPAIQTILNFINRQAIANKVGRPKLASLQLDAAGLAREETKKKFGFNIGAVEGPLAGEGVSEFFQKREKEIFNNLVNEEINKQLVAQGKPPVDFTDQGLNFGDKFEALQKKAAQAEFNKNIRSLEQSLKLEKDRLNISSEQFTLKQEQFKLDNLNADLELLRGELGEDNNLEIQKQVDGLKAQVDLQQQIVNNAKALTDPFRQLSNIIAQDIGNGIKGLIKGTQSLNDLLLNVVNKIGDAFLNAAIFGNFGGGSVTGGLLGILGFANGGRPPVGRASIVGERGPELFVPDRAGTIIPNNAMGGAMNVVVNVDASGSSVEGDEEQANAFGSAIATAIQSELIKQKRPGGLLA